MKHDSPARSLRSRREVAFAGSAADPAQFPKDRLPEVAFLGRSNVGKSTLLNALAGTRGLARVSSSPGRTRLVNFFRMTGVPKPGGRGQGELYLVDLPGYGYAKAAREVRESFEKIAVSYLLGREALRLCVFIVDARHEPGERDEALRSWLDHHGLPWALAVNKIDALSRNEARARVAALEAGIGQTASRCCRSAPSAAPGSRSSGTRSAGAAFGAASPEGAVLATRGPDGRC